MSSVFFPFRPRPNDMQGWMVVQKNLDYLGDKLRDLADKYDSGSNLVPTGAKTVSVSFRVSIANPIVSVTPVGDPGQGFWVSGKNPLGFVFNLGNPAHSGGVPFDWIVRGSGD